MNYEGTPTKTNDARRFQIRLIGHPNEEDTKKAPKELVSTQEEMFVIPVKKLVLHEKDLNYYNTGDLDPSSLVFALLEEMLFNMIEYSRTNHYIIYEYQFHQFVVWGEKYHLR